MYTTKYRLNQRQVSNDGLVVEYWKSVDGYKATVNGINVATGETKQQVKDNLIFNLIRNNSEI